MTGFHYYESDRGLGEYLLFHYGKPGEILPWPDGPSSALEYPARCVSECLDADKLPGNARALALGWAVGRSTFELARHCREVIGIDFSHRFIEAATHLQQNGRLAYAFTEEGTLASSAEAIVAPDIDRTRVRFEQGDAQSLRADLETFDVLLLANLLDRLATPATCLDQLAKLTRPGGQLIITTPCTWLEEYTPRENWLGGFKDGDRQVRTLDSLRKLLDPHFDLTATRDLPFLIREHARKFQWSVALATTWTRRPNSPQPQP